MRALARRRAALRQVMALLTVLASFMFQVRQDALGQLTPAEKGGASHATHARHAKPVADSTSGHSGHAGTHHHHAAHTPAIPAPVALSAESQAPQSSQTPRPSEPSNHHHSAHCPFCLTNAFGAEAGVSELPLGPPDFLPAPEPQLLAVYLAARYHPEARAPPVL